jgi:hypothetical protein
VAHHSVLVSPRLIGVDQLPLRDRNTVMPYVLQVVDNGYWAKVAILLAIHRAV